MVCTVIANNNLLSAASDNVSYFVGKCLKEKHWVLRNSGLAEAKLVRECTSFMVTDNWLDLWGFKYPTNSVVLQYSDVLLKNVFFPVKQVEEGSEQ